MLPGALKKWNKRRKARPLQTGIVPSEGTRLPLQELWRNTLLKPGTESTATEDWDTYPQDYYLRPGQVQGCRGQADQSRMFRACKVETQLLPVPWGNMFEKFIEAGLSLREGTARSGNPLKGNRARLWRQTDPRPDLDVGMIGKHLLWKTQHREEKICLNNRCFQQTQNLLILISFPLGELTRKYLEEHLEGGIYIYIRSPSKRIRKEKKDWTNSQKQ